MRISNLFELVGFGNQFALPKDHNHSIINNTKMERGGRERGRGGESYSSIKFLLNKNFDMNSPILSFPER